MSTVPAKESPERGRPLRLVTAAEAARTLSCSAKTIRRLVKKGELTAMTLLDEEGARQKSLRVTVQSLCRFQERRIAAMAPVAIPAQP